MSSASSNGRVLLPHHQELLDASAIAPEVAAARGYWTATRPGELERWFGQTQRRLVPALVIPTYDVRGEVVFCQLRPDQPRTVDGRVRKYELPYKARMALDVPPAVRAVLGDPSVPLVICEGARKADSGVSVGLYAVDLVGVWTWRGRNGDGGLIALADFEYIALNGRIIYLTFDSDAMTKREVHAALVRFAAFLRHRGADVRIVYLPSGDGGAKTGLDDYLADGHDRDDVLRLAVDELRPLAGHVAKAKPKAGPAPATGRLLERVRELLRRYLVLPSEHTERALALWVLHTWAFDAARITPYLFIRSAEPESGKTRVLEVLRLVCRTAKRASTITEAALYQAVEAWKPTLLLDEVDNVFTGRGDREVALCAVLNDGYELGGTALRGTQDMEPREFSVFCPKAMSGIDTGRMPDTLRSRCIVITMKKRLASEPVERFYPQDIAEQIDALRDDLEHWAGEHLEALAAFRPAPIMEISDRTDETWRLLLAVASLAGGGWPAHARAAAVALAKANVADDAGHGHILLLALRKVFDAEDSPLASKTICTALNGDEELPFGDYSKGAGISPRSLAKLLRPYGIKPKVVRVGAETPRGYDRDQLAEAWERYDASHTQTPPPQAQQAQQTQHPSPHGNGDVADVADVADTQGVLAHLCVEGDPSSNGHVVIDDPPAEDDYAARYRRRQAEGAWSKREVN
jgi:hypothetical protein